MLRARCPFCSEDQEVDEKLSGQAVKCVKCAKTFNAPVLFKMSQGKNDSVAKLSEWKKREIIDRALFIILSVPFLIGSIYGIKWLYRNVTGIADHELALRMISLSSWTEAVAAADEALSKDKKNHEYRATAATAHAGLGRQQKMSNMPDEALESFRISLEYNPNDAGIHRDIANMQLVQGKKTESLESFRRVLAIDPEDLETRYQIGLILAEAGDYAGAKKEFDLILAGTRNHFKARYAHAVCVDQLGSPQEAKKLLEDLISDDPGNRDAISRIQLINNRETERLRKLTEKPEFVFDVLEKIGFPEIKDGKKCYYFSFQFKNTTASYFSKLTVTINYSGFDGAKKLNLGSSTLYVENIHPGGIYPVEDWFMNANAADKIRTQEISIVNE